MAEPILIGVRGWEYPPEEAYYPPELPEEWRFCFYSNRLRSVLVPAQVWAESGYGQAQQWSEDCDPQFRFVLEAPASLAHPSPAGDYAAQLAGFLTMIEPIRPRVAGMLLRVAPDASAGVTPDADWLAQAVTLIGAAMPVCVDLPPAWRGAPVLAILSRAGAGRCWHVEQEPAPLAGGRLLVALGPPGGPKALRGNIDSLIAWRQGGGVACLFLEGPGAAQAAGDARIIAEVLGA